MGVPAYDRLIEPLLRFLAACPNGTSRPEAEATLADQLGLTAAERILMLPSGRQGLFANRVGWAHDRLKRARYSTSQRRGLWQITDAGREFVVGHPAPLSEAEVKAIADTGRRRRYVALPSEEAAAPEPTGEAPDVAQSPEEQIEEAVAELRDSVSLQLLELIKENTPEFFEHLVLDLLHAMGYGVSRTDRQHVGGSGDGGIDGVISLDRLGLEKVCVQAKRWFGNSVGRPEVQAFYGALAGNRVRKGVLITTSNFSQQAIDFAKSVEGVVLVDGERLTQLMIDHGVGVQHRPLQVPRVDSDYFDV
ncbi:MAG: restriction endonuclease [Planctomycetota bacterium]